VGTTGIVSLWSNSWAISLHLMARLMEVTIAAPDRKMPIELKFLVEFYVKSGGTVDMKAAYRRIRSPQRSMLSVYLLGDSLLLEG
jgi:hypothetical protein